MNSVVWVFSGGKKSVLSATVSSDPSHREEEGEERSLSVVVENELGNSSEIVVVLQSEAEWVGGVFYCAVYTYSYHVSPSPQSHMHSLACNAYTAGQPLSVSDSGTVAVIGLSVTVAMVIVVSVIIVIISMTVIIVLCQCQGR